MFIINALSRPLPVYIYIYIYIGMLYFSDPAMLMALGAALDVSCQYVRSKPDKELEPQGKSVLLFSYCFNCIQLRGICIHSRAKVKS